MNELYAQTGLGRTIDLRLSSNRIAVIGAVLGTLGALALEWTRDGTIDLFGAGAIGVSLFLAWAIARELDPDHPGSATVALVLAAGALALGPPAAAIVAVILMSARVMTGTVGSRLRPADIAVLTLVAGYAGTRPEAWGAIPFLLVAIVMARPQRPRVLVALLGLASVGGVLLSGATPNPGALPTIAAGLIAVTVVAVALTVPAATVATRTDTGWDVINPWRVTLARLGAAFAIVAGSLLVADGGALALTPAIAALVGVAVIRLTPPQIQRGSDQDSNPPAHRVAANTP
jgi:hypothetical protein